MTICFAVLVASLVILAAGIAAGIAGAVAMTRANEERERAELAEQSAEELYELATVALETIRNERVMND